MPNGYPPLSGKAMLVINVNFKFLYGNICYYCIVIQLAPVKLG